MLFISSSWDSQYVDSWDGYWWRWEQCIADARRNTSSESFWLHANTFFSFCVWRESVCVVNERLGPPDVTLLDGLTLHFCWEGYFSSTMPSCLKPPASFPICACCWVGRERILRVLKKNGDAHRKKQFHTRRKLQTSRHIYAVRSRSVWQVKKLRGPTLEIFPSDFIFMFCVEGGAGASEIILFIGSPGQARFSIWSSCKWILMGVMEVPWQNNTFTDGFHFAVEFCFRLICEG